MSSALLIVRRADNGYDHAERNAQQQCQDRRLKRGEQTVEIQFPTAGGEKALVKADEGVVPEAQGLTGLCLCRQISFYARKGRLTAALTRFAYFCDYFAGMYLSMMDWMVPSALSSASALFRASCSAVLSLAMPMA